MFQIERRRLTVDTVSVGDVSADLVGAETSLTVGGRGVVFSLAYRRPVRVELGPDGPAISIRDHVMLARLVALATVLLSMMRRIGS